MLNGNLRVLGTWTEEPDVIRIVYQGWWHPRTVGLRRQIESDWPLEAVVLYILTSELGESWVPAETLESDEHGVLWWTGDTPGNRVQY